ncbi:SO_0444 family Cu/Zn efflux transporter [Nitrosophilus kaiyonis]|uniref:SO_0444 family Cu/Zn efflux transporter n=1 Tax=Nitrosophilus kaiyonis TaxID=2930200 RepID=UPI00248F5A9E|nr:SO_0444 family Cu/Zn efflux transporter [Nitrosophilus kaiyonis]
MAFVQALIELSNAMALYILFGLLIAGFLHEIVPQDFIKKHLGKSSFGSVIKATLFGIPIPVCSCGVIPLATALQKSGASRGSVLSFLISTPITGIDSILATFGMFGWVFTIYRIVTSIIMAMIAGLLVNIQKEKQDINNSTIEKPKFTLNINNNNPINFSINSDKNSCCSSSCECKEEKRKFSFINALRYGFITLLGDIAKPLFWGLIIGAAITVAIPQNLSALLSEYVWLSYILAVIIAIPMYVCATASLPIAAALMLNGVSAGAAFVFLSAGPATNTVTIGVVKKMLGNKAVFIYLGVIAIGSVIFGLGLDFIFKDIDVKTIVHIEEKASILMIASSIILWILISYHILKDKLTKKSCCN